VGRLQNGVPGRSEMRGRGRRGRRGRREAKKKTDLKTKTPKT
jgi:hypothetical protein